MIDKLAGAMSMQIATHVITLHLHVKTHLVETRGTDHVALAVHLPGDGGVLRAHLIVAGSTSSGASVVVDILAHLLVDDHTTDHVTIVKGLVINNSEDLSVHTNGRGNILSAKGDKGFHGQVAEDTIVEGSLVLVDSSTSTGSRVRPVHLIGLADLHAFAVLPFIRRGELGILSIVMVAAESITNRVGSEVTVGPLRERLIAARTITAFIKLSNGIMLGSQMPVNIDRAHTACIVRISVRLDLAHVHVANVSLGDIGSGLGSNSIVDAQLVVKGKLSSSADIVVKDGIER
mmetsp:Transcript_19194/g.41570  ORF Transcript_19194/g.41570 Transcript_19194/m.41570 type:complete len:290 (+) Transcript_19194:265-1134(+)